ncbi:MAG: hypothetical protein QOI73_2479 [Solirubrobacteraceae bacterium]|nr:hypothetical protein [Solirubrobacteraceae bacterium]
MREIFKGFLMLRLLAFVPMGIIVLVAFGVSALTRGADVLGIALLAAGAVVVAALAWLVAMRRRAS